MIDMIKFFDENIKDSMGCTDPTAIALAASAAFNAIKGRLPMDYLNRKLDLPPRKVREEIEHITVKTDRGIFKNALQVGITSKYGLQGPDSAAALGVFCDPGKSLELFDDLSEEETLEATNLIKEGKVDVVPNYDWDERRIEARVTTKDSTAIACIDKEQSNIAYIEVDGKPKFEKTKTKDEAEKLKSLRQLSDFIEIIEEDLPREVNSKSAKKRIEEAIRTNHKASLIAEKGFWELDSKSVGLGIKNLIKEGYLSGDYIDLAEEKVSLATEGRMAGLGIKVMTCARSGNMGLVVTIPLIAVVLLELKKKYPEYDISWDSAIEVVPKRAPENWEKLIRAVGLGYLITNYVGIYSGKMSASCGCGTKAGVGVAAGIAYYLTPADDKDKVGIIGRAINHMAGSIVGMICDGAKRGCALKTAAATRAAMESALLACTGFGLSDSDGIAHQDAMITLQRIGAISRVMERANRKIIEFVQDIPLSKHSRD